MHKISNKFEFRPDQTTDYGDSCPLRPANQPWSNFMCSITGVGKGCIRFWGRLDQNSGVHGNRKPLLTYNGENGVSTFSRSVLIRSFLYFALLREWKQFFLKIKWDFSKDVSAIRSVHKLSDCPSYINEADMVGIWWLLQITFYSSP